MERQIIEKRNAGIKTLNEIYNKSFQYSTNEKVYLINNDVIVEECDYIDITTNISNKKELEDFIDHIKKTDIVNMFKTIELTVDFKEFINGYNLSYITTRHGTEFYNNKKAWVREEYFTVTIYTDKI